MCLASLSFGGAEIVLIEASSFALSGSHSKQMISEIDFPSVPQMACTAGSHTGHLCLLGLARVGSLQIGLAQQ